MGILLAARAPYLHQHQLHQRATLASYRRLYTLGLLETYGDHNTKYDSSSRTVLSTDVTSGKQGKTGREQQLYNA